MPDGFIHRPTFPKLRNLVSLDQKVLDVVLWEGNIGDGDDLHPERMSNKRACQLRYAILRGLCVPGHGERRLERQSVTG